MDDQAILDHYASLEGRKLLRETIITPEQLEQLKGLVREEGRCGSLQTADGLPCRRFPKPAYTVCNKHGERAPQTKAKAERALAAARLPAIEHVLDAMDQAQLDTCDSCGFPRHTLKEKRRLDMLARMIFDRTGLGPHSKVTVNDERDQDETIQVELLTDVERFELAGLIAQVRDLKERVRRRLELDAAHLAIGPGTKAE